MDTEQQDNYDTVWYDTTTITAQFIFISFC